MNKLLIVSVFLMGMIIRQSYSHPIYDLLIKNVNIIDVKKGKTINNQNIFIQGDRIIIITDRLKSEHTAKITIDGSGKYLIPGLWDMHTHNWWNLHFSNYYVANGVLGVRNMYTPMEFIKPLKDSIDHDLIIGPKYFAAGRVIEGSNPEFTDWLVVDSVHKIKSALDILESEGSDFVKIYNKIPRQVYFELMKEAHKRGIEVEGHLPMSISAIEGSKAGQKSFEHLLGLPDLCTYDTIFKNKHNFNWFAAVMKENDYGTLQINEKLALKNLKTLKKNNTYVCPTLVVWYNYFHPDTLFENNPLINKMPKEVTEFWQKEIEKYRKKDFSYKNMALSKYNTIKKVTNLIYKAGVPMITGTDVINPYCYPGFSLHDEFELLAACGIPNSAILKMATYNPASFFHLKDHGLIKEGYVASIVLLNENPLNDIKNTLNINTVIIKGKVLNEAILNKMKN